MKIAAVVIMLLAANVIWFWLMGEMRAHGYPVSYVNFLTDLKSLHRLIVDTRATHRRHVLTFGLVALYGLVAAIILTLFFL
jgi:hypothetical protein